MCFMHSLSSSAHNTSIIVKDDLMSTNMLLILHPNRRFASTFSTQNYFFFLSLALPSLNTNFEVLRDPGVLSGECWHLYFFQLVFFFSTKIWYDWKEDLGRYRLNTSLIFFPSFWSLVLKCPASLYAHSTASWPSGISKFIHTKNPPVFKCINSFQCKFHL